MVKDVKKFNYLVAALPSKVTYQMKNVPTMDADKESHDGHYNALKEWLLALHF